MLRRLVSAALLPALLLFQTPLARADLPALIDLANLDPDNRSRVLLIYGGPDFDDPRFIGSGLAFGDMNGDGLDDLAVGSLNGTKLCVIFGSASLRGATIDLNAGSDEAPTAGELRISGPGVGRRPAFADVNGDGYDDLILVGSRVHVAFGSPAAAGGFINLNSGTDQAPLPNETRMLNHAGFAGPGAGAGAGDLNDDGYDDFFGQAFSATTADMPMRDGVVLAGGGPLRPGTTLDLTGSTSATLAGGEVRILSETEPGCFDNLGVSSAFADFDRDGYSDLTLGAPRADDLGRVYALFGGDFAGGEFIDLAQAPPRPPGPGKNLLDPFRDARHVLHTQADSLTEGDKAEFGITVVIVILLILFGGLRDGAPATAPANSVGAFLAAGNPLVSPLGRLDAGAVWFFPDTSITRGGSYALQSAPPPGGLRILGAEPNDQIGRAMAAGDVNGDGGEDVILGAPFGSALGRSQSGKVHVVFGSQALIGTQVDLSPAGDGEDVLIAGAAADDNLGWAVASGGDMDGDGFADFAVGAQTGDNPGSGCVNCDEGYVAVIFGEGPAEAAAGVAHTRPGTGPEHPLGGRLSPVVRARVGFGGGAGPGGGASSAFAEVNRTDAGLSGEGLPSADQLADVYWRFTTDRENFFSAQIVLQYTDAEIAGIEESALALLHADAPTGPWSEVELAVFDPARNEVRAVAAPEGCFALGRARNAAAGWERLE